MTTTLEELIEQARAAKDHAYAPYSHFKVGAALLTKNGRVFVGCNFENASFGACICAERGAVGAMVVSGERELALCAVVTEGETAASPCGICRQVLAEFARDMPIACVAESTAPDGTKRDVRRDFTLAALLPDAFDLLSRR